jgi:RNA polymerase sigma-54 factor
MAIQQKLELRQSQSLSMTPQMQQAIRVLQMSALELQEFVASEIIENPLLDRDTDSNEIREEDDDVTPENNQNEEQDAGKVVEDLPDYDPGSNMAGIGKGGTMAFDTPDYSLENRIAETKTLRDHLLDQMVLEIHDNKDRMVAGYLIDSLDSGGYLREPTPELAELIGCAEARVKNVLAQLKTLQPAGVFARDLAECLALQLKEKDRLDPAMRLLLANLGVLAGHDIKKLCRICRVTMEDLQEMIGEIRELNPKPGAEFDDFVIETVVADAVMKKLPKESGGGWGVELNPDTLPKLLINHRYYTEVKGGIRKQQDREYLNARMAEAKWLLKTLDQRAQSILRVAAEIVRRQEGFFAYGVEYLKPMVLRDVAEALDLHESTVSRVTAGKFIGTPRGVFELRYFFSRGLSATDDGAADHATESVKARIRTMVDEEDPKKILSDDKLVKLLKAAGVDIARRTVAKYREAMGIPSSVQRRRMKNMGA